MIKAADIDRQYSDPSLWNICIDRDDAPDGTEGGYDRYGNYVPPAAMVEIVRYRRALLRLLDERYELCPTQIQGICLTAICPAERPYSEEEK